MGDDVEIRRLCYEQLLNSHTEHYGEPNEIQKDYLRQLAQDMTERTDVPVATQQTRRQYALKALRTALEVMLMMKENFSRREQLIAGAVTDSLSEDEWNEFEQARAADSTIDEELAELRATAARLEAADITWREAAVPASLEERILNQTSEPDQGPEQQDR